MDNNIMAVYHIEGFVEIFINGNNKSTIFSGDLDEVSKLLQLIAKEFNINLIEKDI